MTDADRATQTLRDVCAGKSLRTLSRADVDDVFWAIRQLNERNHLIADVLAKNDNAVLDEADVRTLEESVAAMRQLYVWVSKTRAEADALRGITAYTLQQIANEYNCTLRALRHANPELDDLRADDDIPRGHHVRVPKGSRRSPERSRVTLALIAEQQRVKLRQLRAANPHLDRYGDDEPLPKSAEVELPPRGGTLNPKTAGRAPGIRPGGWYRTNGKESVKDLAHTVFRCTVPQVRTAGPNRRTLNGFGDVEPLPTDTEVMIPDDLEDASDDDAPRRDDRRDDRREHSRHSSRRDRGRGRYDEDDGLDDGDYTADEYDDRHDDDDRRDGGRRYRDDDRRSPRGRRGGGGGGRYDDDDDRYDDEDDFGRDRARSPRGGRGRREAADPGYGPQRPYVSDGTETISEIASHFGVSPRDLIAANQRELLHLRRHDRVPRGVEVFPP